MTDFGESEMCARCGRSVGFDDPDFIYGEIIEGSFVCDRCISDAELQAIDEDDMALADALASAGLGEDADREAMDGDEYEMRKEVAAMIYRQEAGE